jgi:RNA polymerase sigma factor (sigma-70 family)
VDAREATVAELVSAAHGGNRAAFASLYERFHRVVHAIALARVAACDAGDVVQDVFADAWSKLTRLRDPAAFPGWILAIARNRAIDAARRQRPVGLAADLAADLAVDPPPRVEAAAALRAIRELPRDPRAARDLPRDPGHAPGRGAHRARDRRAHRDVSGVRPGTLAPWHEAPPRAPRRRSHRRTRRPERRSTRRSMSDYLFDKKGDDPAVAELEGLLGAYVHRAPLREPPPREPPRRRRWIAAAAAAGGLVAAAAVILLVWRSGDASCAGAGPGFAFSVEGGPARCGGGVASRGTLPVGAWLETSSSAVAGVRVADIGQLTVYGDSRLRLVDTGAGGHRMQLARGKLAARVVAPPRLFVVDTPGATAVDLGCAYELVVDRNGRTRLRVTSGAVSLEGNGLSSYAPMGTEVVASPGRGPGTPVVAEASDDLHAAVARFDGGDPSALPAVLRGAGPGDTVTLWNLLTRTSVDERKTVVAQLVAVAGLPDSVRTEDVVAGDAAAIERWRIALEERWICPDCFQKR